jgi:hypothetical protein
MFIIDDLLNPKKRNNMEIKILKVESQADVRKFVKCQWKFYKNDALWVPPIVADRLKLLDTHKNPFYKHAEIQLFLAYSSGEIVGRIAAITNENHNITHNDKVGFFGFFESIDNQDVADSLFDAASDWLKKRDKNVMRGPENPSMNDEIGLLIDGFDSSPLILMTYNPRYYINLIENYGFKKAKDVYAYRLQEGFESEKLKKLQGIIKERYKVTLREANFKDKVQFKKDVDSIKEVYNAAWEPNWGFVKSTDEEMDFLADDLKMVADPRMTIILEVDGKLAGFGLALPNINECLIHNKRGTMLGALWHLLTKKKKVEWVRIMVLGVKPEYQKTGIDAVLYYEVGNRSLKTGIKYGEASWVLEDNIMMSRGLTQTMKGSIYKTYRLYDIDVK